MTAAKPRIRRDTHIRPGFHSAVCACGWTYHHVREKVTDRAVERHESKCRLVPVLLRTGR